MTKTGLAALLLLVLIGCSGDDDDDDASAPRPPPVATGPAKDFVAVDANKLCDAYTACPGRNGVTKEQCVDAYTAVRVAPDCRGNLEGITCASKDSEVFTEACFPKCRAGQFTCDGPLLTACAATADYFLTVDCNALCGTDAKTWTGVCGLTYGTQTEATPKCFCK